MNIKTEMGRTMPRWVIVALFCLAGLAGAFFGFGWQEYVQSWVGVMFKALSGGAVGWCVSRYGLRLDLSRIAEEYRAIAAVSQALLIGAFAIAVATGA